MNARNTLITWVLAGVFAAPAFAQSRPSTLTPGRDTAPPGATLNIAVSPALAAEQPAGSHLVLRSAQGRRGSSDIELRITDWRGPSIRAAIPRDAPLAAGAMRLVLLGRRDDVLAHSGNQLFRVAAAREAPAAERAVGATAARTDVPDGGPAARVPVAPGPDAANRHTPPARRAGVLAADGEETLPGSDPRAGREERPGPAAITTPGVLGKPRDPEPAANGAGARASPRPAADFVVIGDDSRTIPGGMRAVYSFDLPAGAQPTGRAVLLYVINPDSPPGGVDASVTVHLNGSEVRSHSYSDSMVRTMFETLDARRGLRPGANTLEFRARGNATKISDIVLMYHRQDREDAPTPPAKAVRSGEPAAVVRR